MSQCLINGVPKRRWTTRSFAKEALRYMTARGTDVTGQQPYRCQRCGYFHLGHYPTAETARAHLRERHRSAS